MSYRIAVASSDGQHIDLTFGAAEELLIYQVSEDGQYCFLEYRKKTQDNTDYPQSLSTEREKMCGQGAGCAGSKADKADVGIVADCRCVICKRIGFNIVKQLEKMAIVTFDITGEIEESLMRIATYFTRIDKHQTLRNLLL